jgi:protein phosphatase PTC7
VQRSLPDWDSQPNACTDCSYELARYDDVEDEQFLHYYDVDPVEVLQTAVDRSLDEAQAEGIVGSTTALLAVLRRDELRVANLGDCCCSCVRFQRS